MLYDYFPKRDLVNAFYLFIIAHVAPTNSAAVYKKIVHSHQSLSTMELTIEFPYLGHKLESSETNQYVANLWGYRSTHINRGNIQTSYRCCCRIWTLNLIAARMFSHNGICACSAINVLLVGIWLMGSSMILRMWVPWSMFKEDREKMGHQPFTTKYALLAVLVSPTDYNREWPCMYDCPSTI